MQQIKLSECKEGDKICLPSWQNGQKYRVVYWVGGPTSIVKYHTKVDDKGVKKRHKISIPAVWVSHLEKGAAEAIRIENGSITPTYIQYLWVRQQGNIPEKVIYIPTEANLPILEAKK